MNPLKSTSKKRQRKKSPGSIGLNSPTKKNSKMRKIATSNNVVGKNITLNSTQQEDDSDTMSTTSSNHVHIGDSSQQKQNKCKPVFIESGYQVISNLIKNCSFQIKPTLKIINNNKVSVLTSSEKDKEALIKKLIDQKYQFYTFAEKGKRNDTFVLKGFYQTSKEILLDLLKDSKISAIFVKQISFNADRPIYMVQFEYNTTNIHQLNACHRVIDNIYVRWELLDRKKKIHVQCSKCRRWGHTQANCGYKPRCIKCINDHEPGKCPRTTRNDTEECKVTCVNCTGNHPANSRTCPEFLKYLKNIENSKPKKLIRQQSFLKPINNETNPTWPKLPEAEPNSSRINPRSRASFAEAVNIKNKHKPKSSLSSETATVACTLEEFAIFYLGMVKSQTDEFIKNNTSTCNTPHKIQLNTIATTDADKSSVGDFDGRSSSFQRQHANFPQESRSGKSTKRQISRELFVNQDKSDCDNNQNRVVPNSSSNNNNESRGQRATSRGGGGKSQSRRLFNESFPEIDNPSFQSTSTPNNMLTRMNKSMGEGEETATPNSSFFSRNSLSFDQSRGGNSSRKSFENHSMSRRNTSSPLCLADFINTSNASSKGGSRKKNNISSDKLQQQQQQQSKVNDMAKPKKRVMPITVSRKASTETPNFISSSFQSENNLLHITTLEADESMPAMPEREILREQRDAISKDFHNEAQTSVRNLHALIKENLAASPLQASQSGKTVTAVEYDEKKVDRRDMLMIMAKIYSFIIDMNYVPNILSEISYLVNLLNSEYNPYEHQSQNYTQMKTSNDIASNLLKNYHNCIFFASCVLNHQKQTLGMLDCTTIRVICVYERIQTITPVLHEHLRKLMQVKMQMDSLMSSHRARSDANDINKVVFYQQETDNRDNFPSDREFMAFKKQRDLFYAILRSWELKHLDPLWDFRANLGMKVRGLLTLLEHPINMAHLAKLFTSQLIISCNFDNELQMALPNIDLSKLSKLRQRLVAPSLFGTQYLFPGNQAFFRDFIICSDFHMMFTEQLKIALISELLQMNDSSMETLSIVAWGNCNKDTTTAAASTNVVVDDDDKEKSFRQEFIVRAETISTMRVIGKFIGFVVSRSYSYDGYRNSLVDQKQMNIRNFIHPDFDVKSIVLRAIGDRKLLVTIPWLVEYLSMLDFITIRLNYYRELFQILYTIYMNVNALPSDENKFCVMPQSNFIVRTCLGWLFEHPNIPEDYYNPGMMLSNIHIASSPPLADCIKVSNASMNNELNPHLENILHAACPFLADFRVSMMPQRTRTEKAVSRTGRYRHITTKIQDKPATGGNNLPQSNREKLIEAFLASQSLSVRKIVDITIDRVSSAVIKDFQVQHMLSVRKEARSAVEIEALTIKSLELLQKRMRQVYSQYLDRLHELWTEDTTANCRKRVEAAFDALLPVETLNDVKKTLINITIEKINEKLQQWRATNISMEIFSNDIIADATKLIEGIGTQELIGSSRITPQNVIIDISVDLQPYEYFEMLQKNLHLASLHPETLTIENILTLIEKSEIVFNKHILPSNFYRNIAFNLLQLILLLIVNCPELITKDLLIKLFNVWRHEKLLDFTMPDRTKCNNDEDANDNENEKNHRRYRQQLNKRFKYKTFIFSNVISSRFMLMMTGKDRKNFEVYGNFLIELIKEKFITVEDVNELSVGLYKYEWSKSTLDDIAFLVHHVKSFLSSTSTSSTAATDENAESHLFMELVADLAREMENF